ncbi:MAG: gliding motility protein GldE [Bacteroidota bacterium]|jgi:gliding motility-associated protein GldE
MDDDPFSNLFDFAPSLFSGKLLLDANTIDPWSIAGAMGVLLCLLAATAFIAASEVAFMGLSQSEVNDIRKEGTTFSQRLQRILERPHHLLATLLVVINFINIAIVLVLNFILGQFFGKSSGEHGAAIYIIEVFIEVFILVLFGEIMPKVYASSHKWDVANFMALPILFLRRLCTPINWLLVSSSDFIEEKLIKESGNNKVSQSDIDTAIDLTVRSSTHAKQDKDLLKSIVKFGNVSARQIMRSRIDVVMVDESDSFETVLNVIRESGYSRLPVTRDDADHIAGILYAKDLIAHVAEKPDYNWQDLIKRETLFIPETKKIDDLLRVFQAKHKHLAIVIDEYGGMEGIVTLEDILEEIVGEIEDEFDDTADRLYEKIDDNTFIFEAKIMLNDVYRIVHIDSETFTDIRGEADSLAGLVLNIAKRIPKSKEVITFDRYIFEILEANARRISKIKFTMLPQNVQE